MHHQRNVDRQPLHWLSRRNRLIGHGQGTRRLSVPSEDIVTGTSRTSADASWAVVYPVNAWVPLATEALPPWPRHLDRRRRACSDFLSFRADSAQRKPTIPLRPRLWSTLPASDGDRWSRLHGVD